MRGWCVLAVVALMGSCADTPGSSTKTKTVTVEDPKGPTREAKSAETGATMRLKGGEELVYVDKNPAYIDCVTTYCGKKSSRDHRFCRQNVCRLEGSSWEVSLQKVSFAGDKMIVEVETTHKRGTYANIHEASIDVWAGLTARHSDGSRFDFPAVGFVAEDGVKTHRFEAKVGSDVDGLVASVWQKKVPCTEGSHGCATYGYAFEDSLYANPKDAFRYYVDFERVPKAGTVVIQVQNAGNSPDEMAGLVKAVQATGEEIFGAYDYVTVKAEAAGEADSEHQGVLYGHREDKLRATAISQAVQEAIGVKPQLVHWEKAPAPFVIAVAPEKPAVAP